MRARNGFTYSADGTRIHYQVIGSGRPLFCVNGLAVPLYFWRQLSAQFADQFQIICWEYRGHGESAQAEQPTQFSYTDFIADGMAVLEELDVRDAVGIGHSSGFQVLLELYHQAPERFSALSSFVGTYGNTLSNFFGTNISRIVFDALYCATVFYPTQMSWFAQLFTRSPLPFHLGCLLGILDRNKADAKEIQVYLDHVRSLDPHFFTTIAQAAEHHSAEHVLAQIEVPTLLIAGEDDKFVPLTVTEFMQDAIPDCELHVIPQGSHGALFETPELFNQRLAQFLWQHRLAPETAVPSRRTSQ